MARSTRVPMALPLPAPRMRALYLVLPLCHALPVCLDTPIMRAAWVKFVSDETSFRYLVRRAACMSVFLSRRMPSNSYAMIRPSWSWCCDIH